MRLLSVLAAFLVLVSFSVEAASNVSAKYDGIYEGAATPAPGLGTANCLAFPLTDVRLEKGFFKAARAGSNVSISGFITEEGYVSAHMARAGHQRSPLDGRLEDGLIVAGFIEFDSGCSWVVHLRPRP